VGLYEMNSLIQMHSGPSVAPWGLPTIGTKEWRAPALDEPTLYSNCPIVLLLSVRCVVKFDHGG
jgi:hypothetical protein